MDSKVKIKTNETRNLVSVHLDSISRDQMLRKSLITSHWMFKALNQNSCYGRQPHFHGTDSYKFKFGSIERPKDDLKDANDRQPTTGLMV